jgi:transposase
MRSIGVGPAAEAFRFSGQSSMDAWTLKDILAKHGWKAYDSWLSQEPVLFLQRVREIVNEFPTWQRVADTGRRPTDERTVLVAILVRQAFDATFRELESLLRLLADFFRIEKIPDANTLSEKNRSLRFSLLLQRLHQFILDSLPSRKSVVATDATGYSAKKRSWFETDYGLRATEPWVKSHCAVEVPQLLYLSTVQTSGRVHESRVFHEVWDDLPLNIQPTRSLADTAYAGEECLETVVARGATPLHDVRADAQHTRSPKTRYQKLVNFRIQWPNRFEQLTADRSLVEATFSMTKQKFGDRIRCRSKRGKTNEVRTKQIAHNLRVTAMREFLASTSILS